MHVGYEIEQEREEAGREGIYVPIKLPYLSVHVPSEVMNERKSRLRSRMLTAASDGGCTSFFSVVMCY